MDDFQAYIAELALKEALTARNGPSGLAGALNDITPQAVSQWRITPVLRVLEVEKATGVPRYRLRPDLYPIEPVAVQHG